MRLKQLLRESSFDSYTNALDNIILIGKKNKDFDKGLLQEILDEIAILEKTAHYGIEEYSDFINRKVKEHGPRLDLRIKNAKLVVPEMPVKGHKSNSEYNAEIAKYRQLKDNPRFIKLKTQKELGIFASNMLTSLAAGNIGLDGLFEGSDFNGDISDWHEHEHWHKITNMADMFRDSKFDGDISKWEVGHVEDMSGMFKDSVFSGDISKWDVGKVINLSHMFFGNKRFNGNLSSWDTSSADELSHMFSDSIFNGDISKWDVSNVFNFRNMFEMSEFNGDISKWQIQRVKLASGLFKDNKKFDQDLSAWDDRWKSVKDMRCMFEGSIYSHDLSNWDLPDGVKMDDMFKNTVLNKQTNMLPKAFSVIGKKINKKADELNSTMSGLDAAIDVTVKDAGRFAKKMSSKLGTGLGTLSSFFV
jgi:hypothetical protein